MPTVRGVTFEAASLTSSVYQSSTSTKTGVPSAAQIASTVGNAVCAGTRISAPGFTSRARKISQSPAVAELVRTACPVPACAASSASSARHWGPRM